MFENDNDPEKVGEKAPENRNEYAKRWENFGAENGEGAESGTETDENGEPIEGGELTEWEKSMQAGDVPAFNEGRPWGFGPEEAKDEAETAEGDELEQAGKILDYGLDTASRIYSLGGVLKAVQNVDETGRDVENPLGAIYEQLATTPEAKQYLFAEMRKDLTKDSERQNTQKMKVGLGSDGEFHERNQDPSKHESAANAISALKRLIEALETEERFASLREKAEEEGKSVVEVLTTDEAHPTLAYLLEKVGGFSDEQDIEEVLDTIAEELNDEENAADNEEAQLHESENGS